MQIKTLSYLVVHSRQMDQILEYHRHCLPCHTCRGCGWCLPESGWPLHDPSLVQYSVFEVLAALIAEAPLCNKTFLTSQFNLVDNTEYAAVLLNEYIFLFNKYLSYTFSSFFIFLSLKSILWIKKLGRYFYHIYLTTIALKKRWFENTDNHESTR